MNKKRLFGIILVLTLLIIIIILIFNHKTKYNSFVIDEDEWNKIISDKASSTNISIKNIRFNDYSLLIDEENSIIYYSVVNVSNKYNPWINYNLSNNKYKLAINKKLSDEILEDNNSIKIMIYNDKEYRIYTLVATNYPILNISYEKDTNKRKIDADIYIFDNYVDSTRRVLKSLGILRIIEEDKEYSFSLKKESLGHNERDNHISVFGMDKHNEYLIKATDTTNKIERYVQFFINNKYKGIYIFSNNEGRRVDNFERNKENNR